ncbi:GIDE domain-containing protein [Halothiobacillus sp.]|jgi:hypothetical protein|uniref:GIDE domain-containing protein n=1 Tax=Halothiobacillus sp. TaxID=1891311 RepID=UPI002616495C|nr:GIDE domain-containing protein [Halothiobacillus sp.]MDD3575521.1 GIDE domain-containing protein [Halothiobacillus sp.]MDD4965949.1 GIDE domain-containing protein [Halothiobacillus sp.]MDY0147561.1 GIDE domain-containing protein [Halothiobacillus sp.]
MTWYAHWVGSLDDNGYHFLLFGLILLTLITLLAGIWFVRRTYWIINTPTSKIVSAHQGYIEIEGITKNIDASPLVSPLTGTACVWYWVSVEHREQSFGDSKRSNWRRIYQHESDNLIAVEDETGECLVDPESASIRPNMRRQWYGNTERPSGLTNSVGGQFFGDYRYTEKLLLPHRNLYVLGWFKTITHDPYVVENESVASLLRAWKNDPQKMKTFDLDRNGSIDSKEWDQAREAARQQIQAQQVRELERPQQTHLMSANPQSRRPYIISADDQTALAKRFRRWGYLLWTGSVLAFFFWVSAYYIRP